MHSLFAALSTISNLFIIDLFVNISFSMVHVGSLVKEVFDSQPRSRTITWFARELHCNRSNIYDIFRRPALDTDMLMNISRILNHDFFIDLSNELQNLKVKV